MISYPKRPPEGEPVHDAAIAWRIRHQLGELDEAERAAFSAWLAEVPEHQEVYAEVEEFWGVAGKLGHHPLYIETRERAVAGANRLRTVRRSIAAAMAAAVIGLGGSALYIQNAPRPLGTQSFHTAVGQRATITLPDGSQVTLNTDTVVRTKSDKNNRLVYLDKGQAFFVVAKDRRHPFVVAAAGRTVTALGTAFDVRVDDGELKVVLVEGKVRVAPARVVQPVIAAGSRSTPPPVVTDMSAGSQLVVVDDANWRLTPTNVARETSWLKGQLVFDDESLGDIVDEMNRYSQRKLVLHDTHLAQHRLSGNFAPGDVDGFARMLRTGGVASLQERPDGEIEIVPIGQK